MSELIHRVVDVGDGRIHCVEAGTGPMVLFVHGFPESWYSWRHQLQALAEGGFRAVAVDVRGYGRSSKPTPIEAYRLLALAGDNVGVVRALGEDTAVIVGHDWGAPIAWTSALIRPDVFRAVGSLSVPFNPRGDVRPSEAWKALAGAEEFYQEYFQQPGRAEAEMEADVRAWLTGFYFTASGDAPPFVPGEGTIATIARGGRMRDRMVFPSTLPPWLTQADVDYYVEEFEHSGFTGGLNRYRNVDRDFDDLAVYAGVPITVPALFVGGSRDGATMWGTAAIDRFPQTVPNLRRSVILEGCGHWTQQERPAEVNAELLAFLHSL